MSRLEPIRYTAQCCSRAAEGQEMRLVDYRVTVTHSAVESFVRACQSQSSMRSRQMNVSRAPKNIVGI